MTDYTGAPISAEHAWRTFDAWEGEAKEIGVIFYGGSGTSVYAMGLIQSAGTGRLVVKGEMVRASFNLTRASFTYGPVQTWPKWPSPPIVEVLAVQALLENGDWLAFADGLRPESIPPRGIAE